MHYLQKELYELLQTDEKIFQFIQNTSLDGVWYWDLENPEIEWMSENFWTTLGYNPDEMPHKVEAWKDIVNEEDMANVEKAIHTHFSTPGSVFDEIIRYKHKTGHTVWIRCKGMAIRNDDGKPLRMLGTHSDITGQVRKEKFLEKCNTAANIGYWEVDAETRELYWSDTVKKIHEVGDSYIPDLKSAFRFYPEGENRNIIVQAVKKAFKDGSSYDVELQINTAKGRIIWVRSIAHTEFFNGSCIRLYGSIQDIDDRKKTELALKESRNQFEMLVENIPGATYQYTVTKQGEEKRFHLEYMSSHIKEISGHSSDEFLKDETVNIKNLIHKEDLERVIEIVHGAIDRRGGWQIDYRIQHKNGSIRWVSEKGNVFANTKGEGCKLIGVLFDNSIQVEARIKRAEERNLLRTIIDNVPVNIYLKDKERRKVIANKAEVEYSGYEKEEDVLGKTDEEIYDDEIVDSYLKEDLKVLNEGESLRELENDMGNGRWALVSKIPLLDNEGNVEAMVGITVDITERKNAELKLKKSEEQFRKTFEFSANGMALIDMKGRYLNVNKAFEEILGYTNEELKNMNFRDLTHPDDLLDNDPLIDELIAGKQDYYIMDKRYIHKRGRVVWAHLAASMIRDEIEERSYFISQITDITREKNVRRELNKAISKLKGILDASTRVAIIGTNSDGIISSFNNGAENLLGYKAKEVVGLETPVIFHSKRQIEKRREELNEEVAETLSGFEVLTHYARRQKFETKEWMYVRKDGTIFPVQLTITEIKNDNGDLGGYLGIASDISEMKQRENELKHLLEINKEQNERLLNFAHIVSHNLRGHASNFSMIMDLLTIEEDPYEIQQYINMLTSASSNLNDTVKNLNDVVEANTKTSEAKRPLNIKESLFAAFGNLSAIANKAGAKINFDVEENETVHAVPAYIDSIFHNILSNAIKYRSPERQVKIDVTTSETDEYMMISFKDNGLGIDLDKHGEKLFGMYKTFHGYIDSRGVGLFITKNQIEAMDGHIEVESEVNVGSIFRVFLPK